MDVTAHSHNVCTITSSSTSKLPEPEIPLELLPVEEFELLANRRLYKVSKQSLLESILSKL